MNRFLYLCLSVTVLAVALTAENEPKIEKLPLPDGPALKRAPDFSKWTVTYAYPPADKNKDTAGPMRLAKSTVTKSPNIYFEQKTYTDGTIRGSWRIGDMQISFSTASNTLNIYQPSSFVSSASGELLADPAVYTDYSKTDFPGLEWVSAQNYVGVQKQSGDEYMVFQTNVSAGSFTGVLPAHSPVTAYINLQTRLPTRLATQESTASYTFEPQPPTPLSLPPELQQLLEKRAKGIKNMTSASPSY